MNVTTNPTHMYSVLIVLGCILNEIYGTRIPLEIVQLGNGARQNDGKIANTEYQVHEIDDPIFVTNSRNSKNATSKTDDWFSRMFHLNHKATTSARDGQEPRIIYQVGVSIVCLFKCIRTGISMHGIFIFDFKAYK